MRILYAEDDPQLRESLRIAAERLRLDYVTVSDAAEAWKLILAGEQFDTIISDNDMPEMSGIELLRLVRSKAETKDTHFILYSGNDSGAVFAEVGALGGTLVDKATVRVPSLLAKHLPRS
jgi:CheY-like chemotaxis protein